MFKLLLQRGNDQNKVEINLEFIPSGATPNREESKNDFTTVNVPYFEEQDTTSHFPDPLCNDNIINIKVRLYNSFNISIGQSQDNVNVFHTL